MTTIKSDKRTINAPAKQVYEKLSNLDNLKPLLDRVPRENVPEDKMQLFDNLKITSNTITIPTGQVGDITLRLTDCLPYSLIQLTGEGTPVPLSMRLEIEEKGARESEVQVAISLDIPLMLKPMVAGPLKKVVDQFASVLGAIQFEQE